ncbi:tetratricopeptide repeat protein [Persicimonas caeni]|uniref:tetratricopeptide repeat protein n=1 Tax=Persicimonas caeni TaxID=2292766 RepID=UPI00143DAA2A|nr:tetratricopeptide repeat protein [Persicimonas caeni]
MRILVAALLLAATGCQTPYETGLSRYAQGQYTEAKQHAQEGLRQEPDDPELNLLMAQTLVAQEEYRRAEPYAVKAFESGEDPSEAGRTLGKIHWELGRPIKAVTAWKAAREDDPESVGDTDFQRALEAAIATAMTLQQFEDALDLRQQLAEIDPEHPEVKQEALRVNRERLAQAYQRNGEYEEAVEIYAELSEAFPDRSTYAMARGRLLLQLERYDKAIEAFEAYVAGADEAARADRMLEVARRAERTKARKVSVHFYDAALEAMAGQASFRRAKLNLTLAALYFDQEEVDKAKEHIDRYLGDMTQLRGLPLSAEVYITAADTAADNGQHSYAIDLLEQALEKAPPSWNLASKLAALYARRARSGEMERVLKTYVERAGGTSDAKLQVARWALNRRNYELAQHFFERAVEHDDVEAGTWLELARVYSTVGQIDKLETALKTYIKNYEHDRYELLDAASMYQKHRLYEAAEEVLLDARKDDPKSLVVVDRLSQLYNEWGKPSKVHDYYEKWIQARGGTAEDYQLVGERFSRQARPNEALPYLEKAAKKGSHHAWLQMADVYSRQRRDIDMKQALEKYLEAAPNTASTLSSVLSRYRSAGMNTEAIDILEQLIALEPGVLSHYQRLSRFYFEQGREQDAVDLWTKYLEQSDRPMETLETISEWFQRRSQPQWILTIYRRLLENGEADPHLYRLVGDTYLTMAQRRGRYMGSQQQVSLSDPKKQARRFYELYLEKASPSRTELIDFASSMSQQKMWDIAARVYAKLTEGEVGGSQLWLKYGGVLLNLGRAEEAEKLFATYYEERGKNVEDARVVADALFDANRYDSAEPYLQKMFASERPNYVQGAFRRLAELYRATERSDKIDSLITTFLQRAQNPTKARQEVLAVLQDAGMYAKAAEQIERIRAFQGDVMGFQLAENLYRAGKFDKAQAAFATYANDNAYPGDAWVTVGDFYARHGSGELAGKAYDKAVTAAADNAKTHQARGQFLILQGKVEEGRKALDLARKKMAPVQREDAYELEVKTLLEAGRYAEGRDLAEEALKTAGRHKDYFQRVVFDYALVTQPREKAQRTIQELIKSSVNLRDKVDMLARNGFREAAAKLLEDEVTKGDYYTASRIIQERSDLLTTLGGFERLEKAMKPMIERPHEGARQQAQIGEYLISQGEYQKGIPYLRSAIAKGQIDFRASLAHAYAAMGYHQEAVRVYQKLLETVGTADLTSTLRQIGAQYEVHGQQEQYLRLLRLLMSDGRYTADAAPLLAELLAERGRLDEAANVIYETTSQSQPERDAEASIKLVVDAGRDEDIDTVVRTLEALAGEGYVEEARGFISQLSGELREDSRVQELGLKLAVARSKESAADEAKAAVADFGLSQEDNDRRLQIAELVQRHGLYDLADELARKGLENPDRSVHARTATFLLRNAVAANDEQRIDELAKLYVEDAQDKVSAKAALAEQFRQLGLDDRAVATAVSLANSMPTRQNVSAALLIAQAAGDKEQLEAMADLYMRVGREPLSYIHSLITRWKGQQASELTRPILNHYESVYPVVYDMRMNDIVVAYRAGDVEAAREKLDEALEFVAYDPYAVYRLAWHLNRAGLFVETARYLAPKLDGRTVAPQTHLLLGLASRELDFTEEADKSFSAYMEASSDEAVAATNVAQELLERKFTDDALRYADLAVQKSPERPEPFFFRGAARLRKGETKAAKRDLDKSIGAGVNRTYGLYHAAYNALKAGEDAVATGYLEQLAKTPSPRDPETPLRLVIQCFVDAERAEAGINFVEERFPMLAAGTGILGEALVPQMSGLYEAAGDHERAYELYESALDEFLVKSPTHQSVAVYMNNLAYTFSTTNAQLERGFDYVRRAIATGRGRNPSYLDTLGWLHYRNGDLGQAETYVRRSLRTANGGQSELTELVEHLAEIERAQGNDREALWLEVSLEDFK